MPSFYPSDTADQHFIISDVSIRGRGEGALAHLPFLERGAQSLPCPRVISYCNLPIIFYYMKRLLKYLRPTMT